MARDRRPRYLQLAEELRGQILRGKLPAGSPLPSATDLATTSGMSRTTVRHAIQLLREWGLVRGDEGRGTVVCPPRIRVRRHNIERYRWEKRRVHASEEERRATGGTEFDTGLTAQDLTFSARYRTIPAPADLAARLAVPPETPLLERTYRTGARRADVPLSLSRSYLVYDMAAANPALLDARNEPWPGGTQHQLFTLGIEIERIIDEITVRSPMPDETDVLRIAPGVPVLILRKTSIDTAGRVVETAETIYPGDRVELVYGIDLPRWAR
ncbi:MAG TPA: GntR family transcriptional regulator [Micromonospora sp.]